MDYVKDIVGNKVHVGDEVIYSEYKGGFERGEVTKLHPHSVTIELVRHSYFSGTHLVEKPCVSRFIKVVKEET